MKKIIFLTCLVSASSVTYAEIIGSGFYSATGQYCQWIKTESDGSGNKVGSDGTGKKIGEDGTNKTGNDGTDKEYTLMLACK